MDDLTASWFTNTLELPADRPRRALRSDLLSQPAAQDNPGQQAQALMQQAGGEGTLNEILPGIGD